MRMFLHIVTTLQSKFDGGKRWRRLVCTLFFTLAYLLVSLPTTAEASSSIQISAVVGFNGFYTKDEWTPVQLTVSNDGPAVNAELQVYSHFTVGDGSRFAQGTLKWPIHLNAHATTTTQIAVPGPLLSDNATVVCVVRGQTVAAAQLTGTAVGNVSLVAVLSRDARIERIFAGLTYGEGGNPVLPVSLTPDTFPGSSNLLAGIDAIGMEPKTLASGLDNAQRDALLNWVKLGGLLIVTGTGNVGGWNHYLPLQVASPHTEKGAALAQFVGESVSTPQDIVASAAPASSKANILIGTEAQPLVASLSVGRGTVIQTGFNPTQPALVAWPSNAALWTKLLETGSSKSESALPRLLDPNGALQLVSASDALSPLKIPSLSFWGTLFLVYAFLIGPALFLVLRKVRVESLGWFAIPLLSILMTIGIYWFGANQRPSGILTEGVGMLELVGDGSAETFGIRAFMSPTITQAFVQTSQPMLMLPLVQQNVRDIGTSTAAFGPTSMVTFDDVGRWAVRYAYLAGAVQNQGYLDSDLWSDNQTITGRVTNRTPYTLRSVAVCWAGNVYEVGDLKPGDSVIVNRDTPTENATDNYLSTYSSYNRDVVHGVGRSLGTYAAKEKLFTVDNTSDTEAILMATADGEGSPALPQLIAGQTISESQSVLLVRQFATVVAYSNSTKVVP